MTRETSELADTLRELDKPPPAPPVRRVPRWATALLVGVAVLGAGWLAWGAWAAGGVSASGKRVVVLSRDPYGKVERNGTAGWAVSSGRGRVTVAPAVGGGPAEVEFGFPFRDDYTTPRQRRVLEEVAGLLTDKEGNARLLGLSAQQFAALEEIRERRHAPLRLDAGAQAQFRTLAAEYEQAVAAAEKAAPAERDARERDRRAVQQKLCDAVEALARAKLPVVRRSIAQRAADAQGVLTPEQWAKYRGDVPASKRAQ